MPALGFTMSLNALHLFRRGIHLMKPYDGISMLFYENISYGLLGRDTRKLILE